jgi:hypothetical protein
MNPDLVVLAQGGDEEAFTSLAVAAGDRLHAVVVPDPARHRPRRGCDAAGAARHLAGPSAATRPGPLRGLVVPASRARLLRRGSEGTTLGPGPRLLPGDESAADDDLSSVIDRDQLECGFHRLSIDHRTVWSCTTTSTCLSTGLPTSSASRPGRPSHVSITRCAPCGRPSRPTRARRSGRSSDAFRTAPPRSSTSGTGTGRQRVAATPARAGAMPVSQARPSPSGSWTRPPVGSSSRPRRTRAPAQRARTRSSRSSTPSNSSSQSMRATATRASRIASDRSFQC